MYWTVYGIVKPYKEKRVEVKEYLEKTMNSVEDYHDYDDDDDRLEFDFDGVEDVNFPNLVINKLAVLVEEGTLTVHAAEYMHDPTLYYFDKGHVHFETPFDLGHYFPGSEDEFVEMLPDKVVNAVLRIYGKQELCVQTPAGPIMAKVIPDDEYPGIAVMNEEEPGQPAAILEYSPTALGDTKSCMALRVYDETNPDDEPVAVYQMSRDLRMEKKRQEKTRESMNCCMSATCRVNSPTKERRKNE